MITDPEILKHLMQQGSLLPKEEMLEITPKKGKLFIGIPKETFFQEKRVALVPEAVSILVLSAITSASIFWLSSSFFLLLS